VTLAANPDVTGGYQVGPNLSLISASYLAFSAANFSAASFFSRSLSAMSLFFWTSSFSFFISISFLSFTMRIASDSFADAASRAAILIRASSYIFFVYANFSSADNLENSEFVF